MLRLIPKWFYVVLAVVCYVGFHQLTKVLQDSQGGAAVGYMAAYWAQYILPGLMLIAAVFLGRGESEKSKTGRRERAPYQPIAENRSSSAGTLVKVDPFRRMSEQDFHNLIKEFFIKNGFAADAVPAALGDGVDLMLRKSGKIYVAQHRHWREVRVGVPMVREQYTVMQAARANGVFVITTGEFTYKAIRFAEDKNISLIDGAKLRRLVNRQQGLAESGKDENGNERAPLCPLCAAEMLIRTGTDQAGSEKRFWSCSNYPKCSGSRDFKKA